MAGFDFFASILEENYVLQSGTLVGQDESNKYKGKVPDALLDFWLQNGRGSYHNGGYWFCDPAPMQPLLELIFAGDPEFDPAEMTTVMYTAAGELRVWHPEKKKIYVDFSNQTISNPKVVSRNNNPLPSDDKLVGDLCHAFEGPFQGDGGNDDAFFKDVLARLGPLERGEIYGFVPALLLGGEYDAANLQKVKVVEHLAMLAQLEPFTLLGYERPSPGYVYGKVFPIRQIGPQG